MPGTPTPKYAIPTLAGSDLARDIDTLVNSSLSSIDSKMVGISEGPIGSRPTSTPGSPGVLGRQYRATDEAGKLYFDFGTGWIELGFASSAHSPGDLKLTARSSAEAGWLMCDGSLVSTTTYAALFAAIGHTYNGNVDPGGGQFRLPDFRGRVPVGVDGAAARLTANDALGQSGGAEKVALTSAAQLPSHNHTGSTGNSSSLSHAHGAGSGQNFVRANGSVSSGSVASGANYSVPAGTPLGTATAFDAQPNTLPSADLIHGHSIPSEGSGATHDNMQPYQVCNVLVKT